MLDYLQFGIRYKEVSVNCFLENSKQDYAIEQE